MVGLGPIAKKVIQRFIYLKLYLLSSGAPKLIFVQSHIDFYIYLEPCARAPEKRAGISPSLVHDWGKFEAAGLSTNTVASQYLHEAFRAL